MNHKAGISIQTRLITEPLDQTRWVPFHKNRLRQAKSLTNRTCPLWSMALSAGKVTGGTQAGIFINI